MFTRNDRVIKDGVSGIVIFADTCACLVKFEDTTDAYWCGNNQLELEQEGLKVLEEK